MQQGEQHVNQLDADERQDQPAESVDQQVVAQQPRGADRAVLYAAQRQQDPLPFNQFVLTRFEVTLNSSTPADLTIDASRLAPRPTLVRIATGRDASDTAFCVTIDGSAELVTSTIGACTARASTNRCGEAAHD